MKNGIAEARDRPRRQGESLFDTLTETTKKLIDGIFLVVNPHVILHTVQPNTKGGTNAEYHAVINELYDINEMMIEFVI